MASVSPPESRGTWPVVRSILIGLVLFVHGSVGAPWPELTKADLSYGVAKDELRRWSGVLTDLGWPHTPEQLSQELLEVSARSRRVRVALHRPFQPLLRLTGTGQAWALFAYPDPYAGRLVIGERRQGETAFTEVYRAPGQGEPDLVDLVEYRRIRGIYDDKGDRAKPGYAWRRLARYLAARRMAEDPTVLEVELRLDLVTLPIPGQRDDPPADARRHVSRFDRVALAADLAELGVVVEAADASPGLAPVGP